MLQGKVAVVTGAGKGIGKAIALYLASKGAKLVLSYKSSIGQMKELEETLKAQGTEVLTVCADVSKLDDVKQLMQNAVERFGKIDILVNNAGITKDNLLLRMKEEEFDMVVDTNLKGTFYCMKAAAAYMIRQRFGKIINISSVVGITGNVGQANYAASKAGIIGLTKSAAKELAARNITVNAVAPGFIKTDMTEILKDSVKDEYIKNIPLKRLGEASDVAAAVCFLASDAADYITGQVLQIDGGMVM